MSTRRYRRSVRRTSSPERTGWRICCLYIRRSSTLSALPRVRERAMAVLADAEDRRMLRLPRPSALLVIADVAYDQAGAPVLLTHRCATTRGYAYINEIR